MEIYDGDCVDYVLVGGEACGVSSFGAVAFANIVGDFVFVVGVEQAYDEQGEKDLVMK